MEEMKTYAFEDILDQTFGPIGTPERDEFEAKVAADIQNYFIGEQIKKAREAQNLTQEQLGAMIGVKKSQASRMEKSGKMTMATLSRVFSALKVPVTLNIGNSSQFVIC